MSINIRNLGDTNTAYLNPVGVQPALNKTAKIKTFG